MAWCIEWQDEAGYPHLRRCAAESEHVTGSNNDGLSGESRSRRTLHPWREVERCAERAA